MATVCELSAVFQESLTFVYGMFCTNTQEAERWGTRWDIVREETIDAQDGSTIRQVMGFSSAYARMDGMGGHVSFLLKFVAFDDVTKIDVIVTSPYEGRGENSAYYRRNHQVALRLLEFCVAPYSEIHPRVGTLKRIASGLLNNPIESTT